MRRWGWLLLLALFVVPRARGAPVKPLNERGGDPRAAWQRLGPEAKEAFILGLLAGFEESAAVAEKPPLAGVEARDLVARVTDDLDAFYADGSNAYTPWLAAAVGALRDNGVDSAFLPAAAAIDSLRDAARAAWLAAHPKAARRARRRAAGAAHLPVAAQPASRGNGCQQFQEWILAEFQRSDGLDDSALLEKIAAGKVEVAGGKVTIESGETREHRDHVFQDVLFHFMSRDTSATADSCTAVVVLVDGVPARLDGVPQLVRNRARRRH